MTDYRRGQHPNSRANFINGTGASVSTRSTRRITGLAYAREWRVRMKPAFDAMYGVEQGR